MDKKVPFFSNTRDNQRCLQACVKSAMSFYFPGHKVADEEIDRSTGQVGGWSWLVAAVVFLESLGVAVELFCPADGFDYSEFSMRGKDYLRSKWHPSRFSVEEANGALENIDFVQECAKKLVAKKLWTNQLINEKQLGERLRDTKTLAIGKTVLEWLSGIDVIGSSHYCLLINELSTTKWRVHDPGLPGMSYRKVPKTLNGHKVFGEVAILKV